MSSYSEQSTTAVVKGCDVMLCQNAPGCFFLNITACSFDRYPYIKIRNQTTIDIVTYTAQLETDIKCLWNVAAPKQHYINVTIDQLEGDSNFTLIFNTGNFDKPVFNESSLKSGRIAFTSSRDIQMEFISHVPHKKVALTINYLAAEGFIMQALPVVRVSESVSFVTSPRFNGIQNTYPDYYDGIFHLNPPNSKSVLISFTHFALEKTKECAFDFVKFTILTLNQTWKKCGEQSIPSQVLHYPIELYFHSDPLKGKTGFKMMFAIMPRSQAPQQLSVNLFNCSVPHLQLFQPVLSCNMLTECVDGEDEQDCEYHSDDCEEGDIDAGKKCYKLHRHKEVTWSGANFECTKNERNLAMLATADEFRRFVKIVSWMRNVRLVYVGAHLIPRLQAVSVAISSLYRGIWQLMDERTAFLVSVYGYADDHRCAVYIPDLGAPLKRNTCHEGYKAEFFCEYDKSNETNENLNKVVQISTLTNSKSDAWNVSVMQCPLDHVTRDFIPCDPQQTCRASSSRIFCEMSDVTTPMFLCQGSHTILHYTLVCDFLQHCTDGSDENFCYHIPCPSTEMQCRNGQCISRKKHCNKIIDCYDGTDEVSCHSNSIFVITEVSLPPVIYDTDIEGQLRLRKMEDSENCPSTHFQCHHGHCFPVYLRCNGINDCPGLEDEAACDSYVCPGLYRCQGSKICLFPVHVCDGVFHCPQYDDELLCETTCSDVCNCRGLAFVCTANFSASSYSELRYLDASGTGMDPGGLIHNTYLIHLRLLKCGIRIVPTVRLPNLIHLDLSWNSIEFIDIKHLQMLQNLRGLVLSSNPFTEISYRVSRKTKMKNLWKIDFSYTNMQVYNGKTLEIFPNLKELNISSSSLSTIRKEGFQSTLMLEILDFRRSPLQNFPRDLLKRLVFLKTVYVDNYILCCKDVLPADFDLKNCHAKEDLVASCEDLLKSSIFRVFLWIFSVLTLVGNFGSFVGRLYLHSGSSILSSFSVFVTCLSVSDFCMGVYLAMIGVADLVYQGEYLWHHDHWKSSVACSTAGFLSVTSSEVSAFLICLITLDRFLVLRFPFSTVHFNRRSALAACGIVWMVGILLAVVPLLPLTSRWKFYGQSSICIPFPFISSSKFLGYTYSFSVMIILNFILFLLIAIGQMTIYFSVLSNSLSSMKSTASREATMARRLTTIVVSDFLCWFPIGLLGVLASTGTAIPSELNVAVAIFVLPFNSALNPFLYTVNVFMEKRLKQQEASLLKRLESRLHTLNPCSDNSLSAAFPVKKTAALHQIKTWINEQVLTWEDVLLDNQHINR